MNEEYRDEEGRYMKSPIPKEKQPEVLEGRHGLNDSPEPEFFTAKELFDAGKIEAGSTEEGSENKNSEG